MLGSGNVATHLGAALANAGHRIVQVYSRTADHARTLAEALDAQAISHLGDLNPKADVFILAISDDAIASVAGQLPLHLNGIVVHTSGSTSIDVLQSHARYGVFYPLQTFSKGKTVDFASIPLALEAGDAPSMAQLESMARSISGVVFPCDSVQRLSLHVAAVFACNFTNHLYAVAADLLQRNGLSFDLIKPLVTETAQKVMALPPAEAQTGPAIRGDQITMEKHLEFLHGEAELQQLYALLSTAVQHAKRSGNNA